MTFPALWPNRASLEPSTTGRVGLLCHEIQGTLRGAVVVNLSWMEQCQPSANLPHNGPKLIALVDPERAFKSLDPNSIPRRAEASDTR